MSPTAENLHRKTRTTVRGAEHLQQPSTCLFRQRANCSNLPPPAPVAAPPSSPLRAREDLGPQHQRRPEAAPAVLEAELAGVLELAEELVGDVPRHHLHHAAAASLGGVRRAVVGRRQAHEVLQRW